ncbi:hypothetical protein HY488_03135 [Candidatus Woesearchaeota archaeon]|nr:hypothetical protein [Candidatus Woesearchaeota archaeon]
MVEKKEDLGLYQSQVQTDVSFTAFMTAVVVFFTGLLLTEFESYDISIKVPISFLIISIFGFLYSTMIFSNAAGEINQGRLAKAKKHLLLGDILSEYLGVYLLIISLPLIINVITTDTFLRGVTVVSSLAGLALYQFSHFSVLEQHFKEGYDVFAAAILLFAIGLFFAQLFKWYFAQLSIVFLLFVLYITYLAIKRNM